MAYNPNNPNGQTGMTGSQPVVIASDQTSVPVAFDQGVLDVFGRVSTSMPWNDIDIQFFRDTPEQLLTITTAGGAIGGTQATGPGYALFQSGTATNGSIQGTSLDKVTYHAGSEIYSMFTAAFLDSGVATSTQFIGYFDDNNGFYLGYTGTGFITAVRTGATDTQTAQSSWNVDGLTGAPSSKFTRSGVPEAIDFTKLNIYRIRFSWLGAAPVSYEVVSPDGDWVLFHQIKQPNTANTPHIQTADLPMQIKITKTAGNSNVRMHTACWGAGCAYSHHNQTDIETLAGATNSALTYFVSGTRTARVYFGTTVTGSVIFEGTVNGKDWFTHTQVIDKNIGANDLVVTSAVTPTAGNFYLIGLVGLRQFRIRVSAILSGTVIVSTNFDEGISLVSVITNVSGPHNTGYSAQNKSIEFVATQTGATVWSPATGKRFAVTDYNISLGGVTAGVVTLWGATAAANTTFLPLTSQTIFRGEFAPSTTVRPGIAKTLSIPIIGRATNDIIKLTTSANIVIYVQVNGYEF